VSSQGKSTAEAFGAKISIAMPDSGLYLVTGRAALPGQLVRSLHGQLIFIVPNSFTLLALMPATSFLALKTHRDIAHAGPVSIDSQRFNHFLELIGLNNKEVNDSPTP
jgi:hypothetical protein